MSLLHDLIVDELIGNGSGGGGGGPVKRSEWYRPPDWPDYSKLDTSEFVKPATSTELYCLCYLTVFTKHPTMRSFYVNAAVFFSATAIGHLEDGTFVSDKTISGEYYFTNDDPDYIVVKVHAGWSPGDGSHYFYTKGPVVEVFGYIDYANIWIRGPMVVYSPTIEAMTLWGRMRLGGMGTYIDNKHLKYFDITRATSVTVTGRFYEKTAFSGYSSMAVCKLPDGIKNTTTETWNPYGMFNGCTALGELNLKDMEYKSTSFKDNFNGCRYLETLILDGVDLSQVTTTSGAFTGCENLQNISLVGTRLPAVAISFSDCTKLTVNSLNAILAALPVVTTATTITIGETNKAKLTEEEIAVATEKGWTVA